MQHRATEAGEADYYYPAVLPVWLRVAVEERSGRQAFDGEELEPKSLIAPHPDPASAKRGADIRVADKCMDHHLSAAPFGELPRAERGRRVGRAACRARVDDARTGDTGRAKRVQVGRVARDVKQPKFS